VSVQVLGFLVLELAFDISVRMIVLLLHSALRIMHLELFLVMVLISCAPVVGVLISFPSWSSRSLPQRGVCWICYPLQGSCCGANDLFSHLTEVA
jgi:hypothetical protein